MPHHTIVYRQPGRFAGWPANYGTWSWENEIVVGFVLGVHDPLGQFHARDRTRPMVTMQARSYDGGETWSVSEMPVSSPGRRALSADEHVVAELGLQAALNAGLGPIPSPCPGKINFTHPDFALLCARTGLGKGTHAWFYLSDDRCRSWQGPYRLPSFDLAGIEARTDYLVEDSRSCLLFLTASKRTGGEGSGVFCARMREGGRTFERVGWVTRSHGQGFKIMPSTIRLTNGDLRTAVRCQVGASNFIDLFGSADNGNSWRWISRPAPYTGIHGNPPSLVHLPGPIERIALVYGYRAEPFGIRARLSQDGGITWGNEIILRADAGCHDIGYPRSIKLPRGEILSIYYFADHPEGERYISATKWNPDEF